VPVVVREPGIELGAFLKLARAVATGGEAKRLVQAGRVAVNGVRETRRHRRLAAGDIVQLADGRAYRVAGPS
jgi:ribosome-associated protein